MLPSLQLTRQLLVEVSNPHTVSLLFLVSTEPRVFSMPRKLLITGLHPSPSLGETLDRCFTTEPRPWPSFTF